MTLDERFKEYVKRELDSINFESIFDAIANKQEYCSGELQHILSLTYYSQILEAKNNKIGEILQYVHLLSDTDKRDLLTIPRLLYIVTICYNLRNAIDKPKSYDNLYI